ncbi:MAG: hypothetical protein IJ761_07345 [Bacteroidales bacterium]|nr:hypothetical protein [Bacteroidales bacterium]
MPLRVSKHEKVSEGLYLPVSKHYNLGDFGVRQPTDKRSIGRRFICTGDIGTGIIEHSSESRSYQNHVQHLIAGNRTSMWRYITNMEPKFDRQIKKAIAAIESSEGRKRTILECYTHCLEEARQANAAINTIEAVKHKMGNRSTKFLVGVISHYKKSIERMRGEMRAIQYNVANTCSAERMQAYNEMVEAFMAICHLRRVWCYDERLKERFRQVFPDLGIFNFIHADNFMPMLPTADGQSLYILPDCYIVARNAFDFDIVPFNNSSIVIQELNIEEPSNVLTNKLGNAACMLRLTAVGQTYYFSHVKVVKAFANALEQVKSTP